MSNTKKHDLPAMPFYVGDWLKCPEVRALPPDYRGLWFDLICFMWESTERGVMVKPNGKPYTDYEIIRMVGLDNQNSGIWLSVLLTNDVCSKRQEDGAVYSRRMVKDEKLRVIRREVGRKGGNPTLLVNHTLNLGDNQFIENENEYVIKKECTTVFTVPTVEDVLLYCRDRVNGVDANKFHDFYSSKGWMVGKNKMKDWKAAVRTWEKGENNAVSEDNTVPESLRKYGKQDNNKRGYRAS